MFCRVKKFLGCVPLDGFGLVIGWICLIVEILTSCAFLLCIVMSLFAERFVATVAVKYAIGLAISLIFVYYTKEFIYGIRERNHRKMIGFRIIIIITFLISILSLAALLILSTSLSGGFVRRVQNQEDENVVKYYILGLSVTEFIINVVVNIAIQIYVFVCINSLYLEFAENTGTQIQVAEGERLNSLPKNVAKV